jgi:uncharacterized protein (DUF2126 family)
LTLRLGLQPRYIKTTFEDSFYYLWQEGTLPANIDPLTSNLKDSIERKTLTQLLDADLGKAAGFTLPIKWDWTHQKWQSGPWDFRRGQMFLISGNSPMGYPLLGFWPHARHYYVPAIDDAAGCRI